MCFCKDMKIQSEGCFWWLQYWCEMTFGTSIWYTSRTMRWAGHVACMGEGRGVHRVLVGKPEGKRPLGRPRHRWEDNIKMDLQEVGGGFGDWMELAQDRDRWRALVGTVMNLRVPKMRGISWLAAEPASFSRRTLLHGVSKWGDECSTVRPCDMLWTHCTVVHSSCLSLTSALHGGVWSATGPGPLYPPVSFVQEDGRASGPVWKVTQNLALIEVQSPDRLSRSESLCRLSYPGRTW